MTYIDNIRALIIIGVIFLHSAVTYSGVGRWYYNEPTTLGAVSSVLVVAFESFTQAFSMGLLFWIAGYFAAPALDRKGTGRFLADRAVRLGIPVLIYMLVIHPILLVIMSSVLDPGALSSAGATYLRYLASFEFLSQSGPMWFALALLIFCAIYAGVRRLFPAPQSAQTPGRPLSDGMLALLAGGIALVAFLIRLVQPIGTAVMNMQLCYFAQYVIYFIFGIVAYRRDWFRTLPLRLGVRWFAGAVVLGIPLWLGVMMGGGAMEKGIEPFAGGMNWTSAAYAVWESFFSVAVSVGLLTILRDRIKLADKLSGFLSSNSFSVYMFHPIVLVSASLLLRPWQGYPVLKLIIAGLVATLVSFLLGHFVLRRTPLLKRVL
jgi:surface polysaccharide O-acyltransferase-like enzyme